jgi:hypothetical protein
VPVCPDFSQSLSARYQVPEDRFQQHQELLVLPMEGPFKNLLNAVEDRDFHLSYRSIYQACSCALILQNVSKVAENVCPTTEIYMNLLCWKHINWPDLTYQADPYRPYIPDHGSLPAFILGESSCILTSLFPLQAIAKDPQVSNQHRPIQQLLQTLFLRWGAVPEQIALILSAFTAAALAIHAHLQGPKAAELHPLPPTAQLQSHAETLQCSTGPLPCHGRSPNPTLALPEQPGNQQLHCRGVAAIEAGGARGARSSALELTAGGEKGGPASAPQGKSDCSGSFLDTAFQELAAAIEALQSGAADAKLLQAYRLACGQFSAAKQYAATAQHQQAQSTTLFNTQWQQHHQGEQQQDEGMHEHRMDCLHGGSEGTGASPDRLLARTALPLLLGADIAAPSCTSWVQPGVLFG